MKLFRVAKDGGPSSTVMGYWLVEAKTLLSVVLLKFNPGTREKYHGHAFNSVSWYLRGAGLEEEYPDGTRKLYRPSWRPIFTGRNLVHRVRSIGTNWVLNFRGPWAKEWPEYDDLGNNTILTHGRRVVKYIPWLMGSK